MTGFESKRKMAQDKLDDADAQVYIAENEAGTYGDHRMKCKWTKITQYTYIKQCGGKVTFYLGKPSDHVCTCGRKAA